MSEDDAIAESVRRHGWHAIGVDESETEPPFVYTIGLGDTLAHPELVVVGLPPRTGHGILSNAVAAIRTGRAYRAGEKVEGLIAKHVVELLAVHSTQHIVRMGYALGYYRRAGKPEALRAL